MGKIDPLSKIKQLTSSVGIYQFGIGSQPDPSFGFALEDQARALIVAHQFKEEELEKIYLDFIVKCSRKDGYFNQYYFEDNRGFVEDQTPITVQDKEEAYGITLWSLLSTNHYPDKKIQPIVSQLKKLAGSFSFPRAIATSLLGLVSLPKVETLENQLIDRLLEDYRKTATPDWLWFENHLTYANPILPWACWEISIRRKNEEAQKIAVQTTDFLIKECQINGIPSPIGNLGWYKKGENKALFDQQPIDAAYMVCCLEKAYQFTKNKYYLTWAEKWWKWFFGENTDKISLVDEKWGCFDGITAKGLNVNQGAESNICFMLAYLSAKRMNL